MKLMENVMNMRKRATISKRKTKQFNKYYWDKERSFRSIMSFLNSSKQVISSLNSFMENIHKQK